MSAYRPAPPRVSLPRRASFARHAWAFIRGVHVEILKRRRVRDLIAFGNRSAAERYAFRRSLLDAGMVHGLDEVLVEVYRCRTRVIRRSVSFVSSLVSAVIAAARTNSGDPR